MPQVTPKPTSEHRPLDWFQPDECELARHDDPEVIRRRGQDMLINGQLQAVGATEDGRLIFGHGRLLAARSAGIKQRRKQGLSGLNRKLAALRNLAHPTIRF